MTRGEGHSRSSKKSSGKGKGSAEQPRESKNSGKGAAAEDHAGGAQIETLSKSELKKLLVSDSWQLPGFNVNKDEDSIDCCYTYYKAYAASLDGDMGGQHYHTSGLRATSRRIIGREYQPKPHLPSMGLSYTQTVHRGTG